MRHTQPQTTLESQDQAGDVVLDTTGDVRERSYTGDENAFDLAPGRRSTGRRNYGTYQTSRVASPVTLTVRNTPWR